MFPFFYFVETVRCKTPEMNRQNFEFPALFRLQTVVLALACMVAAALAFPMPDDPYHKAPVHHSGYGHEKIGRVKIQVSPTRSITRHEPTRGGLFKQILNNF